MSPNIRQIGSKNKIDRLLNYTFKCEVRSGFVEVGEDNFCVPVYYEKFEKAINQFEVRDSDVYIVAHPKTGTTWAQEMIWLIVNNLDYEGAHEDILKRFPVLESAAHIDSEIVDLSQFYGCDYMTYLNNLPEPRCIKTHLHWSLLPEQIRTGSKKPKIISVLRSPEDTCVSFYHHCKLIEGYNGTFDQFCDLFLAGRSCYGPFWKSVLSVWKERHRSNILFIKYSDMKKDLSTVIKKVAKFLGREINDDALQGLVKHLSFESMKKNPAVNFQSVVDMFASVYHKTTAPNVFIRRGIVGGYKSDMTTDQIQKFKAWTKENLYGFDLDVE
ncbi:hypothetical protein PPYR_00971 [Photinus pyralis]|uniref:Sulfotransferase domain-containing protein n=2 Tax=Photinus pyralis TaxID=7054 RepID=A0A5N4B310_PHOPY|nr:sulfotransferase family cytosolic 1B member 1-like [Photinus pyralis]XP_031328233.1 sulfotransferase family cytosolic 1B member 1-like [Photinus pyralis]XP_031328234.1 sulfotransferase family cytosolic 1B member 1-like [Photinus pyralis]XP_031328235.1 sulfotransferase family cytosolic 1B member 1-like [Photinus pyralis]KAB0804001.1 hypothetical protein PPYR_00971 [Photinus pyralis]